MLVRLAAAAMASVSGAPNVVSISDDSSTGTRGKTAGVVFYNTGYYAKYINNVPITQSAWLSPISNISEYEIRATLISGTAPAGTMDTWEPLSSSQSWALQTSTVDDYLECSFTIEIRWTGNNVVQDSATYSLVATGPLA